MQHVPMEMNSRMKMEALYDTIWHMKTVLVTHLHYPVLDICQDRLNAGPDFWRRITGESEKTLRFHQTWWKIHYKWVVLMGKSPISMVHFPVFECWRVSIGTGSDDIWRPFVRKRLVTYPSSRRRMLWDLVGLMLVIWATWLQIRRW